MKFLIFALIPFFSFTQKDNYFDYIVDLKKRIELNNSIERCIEIYKTNILNSNFECLEHSSFTWELDFSNGICFGDLKEKLIVMKPEKNENYLLSWFTSSESFPNRDLIIFKKNKYYYGSYFNCELFANQNVKEDYEIDSITRYIYSIKSNINYRYYSSVTRFYEKTKTYEYAILFYDYKQNYYGIIRLLKPKRKGNQLFFRYNIDILPKDFDFKFLFHKTLLMKRIDLDLNNNFTITANYKKFESEISKLKYVNPKKIKK